MLLAALQQLAQQYSRPQLQQIATHTFFSVVPASALLIFRPHVTSLDERLYCFHRLPVSIGHNAHTQQPASQPIPGTCHTTARKLVHWTANEAARLLLTLAFVRSLPYSP